MDQILALRPFVPAKDFAVSKRYYEALGFAITLDDGSVAVLKSGSFSFILQNFYVQACAENFAMQLLVRDADTWWTGAGPDKVAETFGLKAPRPPTMQSWGLKVGFLFDPSAVLWHIAEVQF